MLATPSVSVRVTWQLFWMCVRMLFVVVRPLLRLPRELRWLQVAIALGFVVVFFHRPAIAYYWFWGSLALELALILVPLLFAKENSLRAWLRRRRLTKR